jgi:cell wall-associated NlpC family hydrolase
MTKINQSTLKKGDVLLNEVHHTAIYLGGGRIVHASINEKGTTTGGRSGDQTGREITTRDYYVPSYGWDLVLRYPDAALASEAADKAVAIAEDAAHGYDQANRWGPNYDCSSLVITAFESVGIPVRASGATYTGNMKKAFKKCGFFEVETETTGAVLCTVTLLELSKGCKGPAVRSLQTLLNAKGFNSGTADGDFGPNTRAAVIRLQAAKGLTQDGCVGRRTWDALINY